MGPTCIKSPLQIVDIVNGCKVYSTSIYIRAKSELTATLQSVMQSQFFLEYNFNYTNVSNFLIWHKTNFATLTLDEIKKLQAKILKLPTMSMDIFNKALENIDENYPFSMSPKLILALLILVGLCTIVVGILFIWYKRRTSFTTSTMENLLKLIPSLKEKIPTLDSLLPILAECALLQNTKNSLTTVAVPQQPQPPPDEHMLPLVLMPKLHTSQPQTVVPYHASHVEPLPSTSTTTDYQSEPISLEMFNHAATDLNKKGIINIKKYKKYLYKPHTKMDPHQVLGLTGPTNNFAMGRIPMHFANILITNGKPVPQTLFLDIMVEKMQILIEHVSNHHLGLCLTANIGNNSAVV